MNRLRPLKTLILDRMNRMKERKGSASYPVNPVNPVSMPIFFSFFAVTRRDRACPGAITLDTVSLRVLSADGHKYDDVRCVVFGLGLGARRAHPPKWGCHRRATTPQAKNNATLRAAVLFAAGFVARSSQTHQGYARRSRLACAKKASPRTSSYLCPSALRTRPPLPAFVTLFSFRSRTLQDDEVQVI